MDNKYDEARIIHYQLLEKIAMMFEQGNPAGVKAFLSNMNLVKNYMRLPITPVDEHLADNLIPYLAIFGGQIKVSKITDHTLTNIFTCEKFFDIKFKIDQNIISVKDQESASIAAASTAIKRGTS